MLRPWMGLIVLGALALAGCGKSDDVVQLNWVPEPEFGGIYAAQECGAFAQQALDLKIAPGGPGTPVVQMVAAGQARFGIASADEVVIARARGMDVVAIFAAYQTCPQGIMVHASRGCRTLADVFAAPAAGAPPLTIAMEPGLPYAKYLQGKYGFTHVKIVPYTGSIGPFLADRNLAQQCFVTSEPLAAQAKGGDPQTFLIAEAGYNPYTAVAIVRGDVLKNDPAKVRAFVAALRKGWQAYVADPRPANTAMGQLNSAMDSKTFAAVAEAQKPLAQSADTQRLGLGAMTAERWGTLIQQLVELKLVEADKAPKAEACFVEAENK